MQNKSDSAKSRLDVEAQHCTQRSSRKEGLEKVGFVTTVNVGNKTCETEQHYFVQDAMTTRVMMCQ